MTITLTDKDLQTDLTDSGQVIDVIALSLDQYTENEVYEDASNYNNEVINYIIENYNFEKAFIDYLNTGGKLEDIAGSKMQTEADVSSLKDGAFYALEYPNEFAQALDDWTEEIKMNVYQYDDPNSILPKDLAEEIEKSLESYYEDQTREWLNGDHRDWSGILSLAERFYSVTDVTVDRSKNEVYFELDEDEAREIIRGNSYDYTDEKVDKMTGTKLEKVTKEQLAEWINSKANSTIAKKREANAKRAEEYAKTMAYQKERKVQAEADRKQKLLQMTK
jgi:anaerobic selenocysteine-containing dehydrogenase